MKINIEIPDWANENNIYIVSRNELVAYKNVDENKWYIKSERCNKCGNCCMVHPKEGSYFPVKKDGSCIHLIKDGENNICSLGMEKPLACVLGEPIGKEHDRFKCSIQYNRE
jgi:hypothetical protein